MTEISSFSEVINNQNKKINLYESFHSHSGCCCSSACCCCVIHNNNDMQSKAQKQQQLEIDRN